MENKELKKLGRAQLLQLLLEAEEENETLKQKVTTLEAALEDRTLRMDKCGDMAKAAMELNGVFTAAEAACRQYTENIRLRAATIEKRVQEIEDEAKLKCQRMEDEATERCERMERETRAKCQVREEETAEKCNRILDELKRRQQAYRQAFGESIRKDQGKGSLIDGETDGTTSP